MTHRTTISVDGGSADCWRQRKQAFRLIREAEIAAEALERAPMYIAGSWDDEYGGDYEPVENPGPHDEMEDVIRAIEANETAVRILMRNAGLGSAVTRSGGWSRLFDRTPTEGWIEAASAASISLHGEPTLSARLHHSVNRIKAGHRASGTPACLGGRDLAASPPKTPTPFRLLRSRPFGPVDGRCRDFANAAGQFARSQPHKRLRSSLLPWRRAYASMHAIATDHPPRG